MTHSAGRLRFEVEQERFSVAIIGTPRSGSTITCSFLNSIHKSSVWGEPHRSSIPKRKIKSRYGEFLTGEADILSGIETFADMHGLAMYGFKEVWDRTLSVDPIQIVEAYDDRLDIVFVMMRNPRKAYSSICALGHPILVDEYVARHSELVEYCRATERARPFFLEKFMASPVAYASSALDFKIVGHPTLLQFTGGGDANTIAGAEIRSSDPRPPHPSDALSTSYEEYLDMYQEYVT